MSQDHLNQENGNQEKVPQAASILLVEDDPNLGFVIEDGLQDQGFHVTRCLDGEAGWAAFCDGQFDACVLDVMLPKRDGFSLAEGIRRQNTQVPILFLTAKGMKEDRLKGFKLGGDDYITKPFSMEELMLRLQVFLRRSKVLAEVPAAEEDGASRHFKLGRYEVDAENYALSLNGNTKALTQREAEVLAYLYAHRGKVIKRDDMLMALWGTDDYFKGRSLDVFISKLRKYLKEDEQVQILNVHGVGFRLVGVE